MKNAWARAVVGGALCAAAIGIYLLNVNVERDESTKFYLYGHWLISDFDRFQEEVAPYNIKLIARSCIIGGEEFEREMLLNKVVYESAPAEISDSLRRSSMFGNRDGKPRVDMELQINAEIRMTLSQQEGIPSKIN
ncbi:hypothetical protein KZZ10_10875 [Alcaligenaceae bacterium LF4-65]|uniref:Uncharacterized protein n=1 Tax=Zwartia hollandica TaxID=324606 RepID=A0A953NCI9_9BURK|nr:hypothetical protein [Zwartia hollandica]MBZ1351149.1 hypothetical protein [Zwartia hollandica]